MEAQPMPSKEVFDQLLKYDPGTGKFWWRPRPVTMFRAGGTKRQRSAQHSCNQWNSHFAGKPAATLKADGYCYIRLGDRAYLAHRVAHKIMTGLDPVEIDHIDGNRSNNKWGNLRNGTRTDNLRNLRLKRNNTSGHHGVAFNKRQQKWTAYITLGAFDNKEEAIVARKRVELALGFHPNHGREAAIEDSNPAA
jgi:hypothetical protein